MCQALIDTCGKDESLDGTAAVRGIALFDNEEVGSASAAGAASHCASGPSKPSWAFQITLKELETVSTPVSTAGSETCGSIVLSSCSPE